MVSSQSPGADQRHRWQSHTAAPETSVVGGTGSGGGGGCAARSPVCSPPVESLGKPASVITPSSQRPTAARADDKALPRSVPTRISIPAIGVDAPFTKLSLDPSGRLQVPPMDNKNLVGWFREGASPGERGASIVVGHLDTQSGPAVFADLESLEAGNSVDIARADGVVAHFEVDSVQTFSKSDFPDDKVYADTATPTLRLITCGGTFNRTAKDYEDNVVVFAHLKPARQK